MQAAILDQQPTSPNRILIYVTGDFTKMKSGSHIRFDEMIEYTSREVGPVTVYSFQNNHEDPWTTEAKQRFATRYPTATLVVEPQTALLRLATRVKSLALMAFPGSAERILGWKMKGQTPLYDELAAIEFDGFLLNFVDGAAELNGVDLRSAIVETIDSKFARYAKYRGLKLFYLKSLMRLRIEISILSLVKGIVAISTVEAGFFRTVCSETPVFHIPKYPNPPLAFPPINHVRTTDMLFVGSSHHYNIDGIKSFISNNGELLANHTLSIAGAVSRDEGLVNLAQKNPNINLLGWVESLADVYGSAKLVIAPVDGTGLNIKVVEALSHGKAVAASQHAIDALPTGYSRCVFPATGKAISELLASPELLHIAEIAALSYSNGPEMSGDIKGLSEVLCS